MKGSRGARLVLRLRPGVAVAEAVRRGQVLWATELAWSGAADLSRILTELGATPEVGPEYRVLSVLVERPLMQLRRVTELPPVRHAVLKSLVGTQSTRYFRRNGVALVTDARWIAVDGSRVAELCAMDAPLLEALAEGAEAAGLTLMSVMPAEADGLSLLPPSTMAARVERLRRSVAWWSMAALVAWGLVGSAYLIRLTVERRRVERALLRLEAPAAALRTLRKEMRTARDMTEAIAATEQGAHDLTRQLTEVASALPDSAFLTSLTISAGGNGAITGYARRAAEVVASLERAGGTRAPRLEGRLAREALGGREWDRFSIAFGDSPRPGRRRGN